MARVAVGMSVALLFGNLSSNRLACRMAVFLTKKAFQNICRTVKVFGLATRSPVKTH